MKLDDLHPVLKRQLTKCHFSDEELASEKLIFLISRVNQEYIDGDQSRYLKERALEISSTEMKEMFDTIQREKRTLELLLNDLTEKDKQLSEKNTELTTQRNYATSLLASIVDMLFVINKELAIVDVNDSAINRMKKLKSELHGTHLASLLSNTQPIATLIQNINENGSKAATFVTFATEIKINANETIPVFLSASIVYNDTGEIQNIICIAKDISELKKLEKENAEKMILLTHAGRLASLGEIATGIAHELNQPLSIIHTNLQTLEMLGLTQLSEQDLKELISSSIRQVDRAAKIINHMRNFARQKHEEAEPIDLLTPINAAIGMFNEQFRLHQIAIITNYEPDLPQICVEEHEIEQIIVNLLSNARYAVETMQKKMGPKFEMQVIINLKYDKEQKNIIFELIDNGIGMSKETLDQCYDPFFTTKPVGEGTGLGLSIVYNIINSLHGKIEISSELEHGTTVRIIIPTGVA
jgi:PAS domain S-box-containing protein